MRLVLNMPGDVYHRLALIADAANRSVEDKAADIIGEAASVESVGDVVVRESRVLWGGDDVHLTPAETRIVRVLVGRCGETVDYRALYDAVRGDGFCAGDDRDGFEAGYRVNIRALVRKIRQKFRAIDPAFAGIRNRASIGYDWHVGAVMQ